MLHGREGVWIAAKTDPYDKTSAEHIKASQKASRPMESALTITLAIATYAIVRRGLTTFVTRILQGADR